MTRTLSKLGVAAFASASLVAAPLAAQSVERAPAKVEQAEGLGGGFGGRGATTPLILLLVGVAAVVTLILLDDDDGDSPVSP